MSHMLRQDAGLRIRHARWLKRLSIRQLAARANVSTSTIVKIEKGQRNVMGQIIYALADELDLDARTLLEANEVAS